MTSQDGGDGAHLGVEEGEGADGFGDSDEEEGFRMLDADEVTIQWRHHLVIIHAHRSAIGRQEVELVVISGAEDDVINRTCRVVIEDCATSA